ncbi:MAG: RNA-binding cell elongation regulator Jag/EloR [Acidimicrobiales bacterium]|jgi:spoIIIJ-associated protein
MEWVETTGRTIEEAKDAALDQLGVDETDAEFVVVTEPKVGLFGRTRGEARVRARVRPTSPRPKRTRTRRQGEQRSSGGRGGSRPRATASTAGVAVAESGSAGEVDEDATEATPGGGNGAGPSRNRNRRSRSRGGARSGNRTGGGEGRPEGAGGDESNTSRTSTTGRRTRESGPTKEEAVGEVLSLEEQGEAAKDFVAGLVQELGLDAEVSSRMLDEDTAEVVVDGQELGLLIGPGGATLGALQELARTFVQKRTGGQSSRIMVDVAGYRAKRAAALQRFTRQIAEEVLAAGGERALEPMSASDRKVVHDTVNDIDGLSTRSEGEDPRRYIVISVDQSTRSDGAVDAGDEEPEEAVEA